MGNITHIAITLAVSLLIIVGVGVWVANKNGEELTLLPTTDSQEAASAVAEGPLSETLSPSDTNNIVNNETLMNDAPTTNPKVTFHTNKGDVTLELFADAMPITTGNFLKLAKEGFYDGIKFHRIIDGFMIQGGDPNTKTDNTATYGQGGPGYTIQDEFISDPRLSNVRGTIAMANTGQPNSGGSQFFINLVDNTGLDFDKPPAQSSHPVFGHVISGMNIVDIIGKVETDGRDLPVDPVVIESVSVN